MTHSVSGFSGVDTTDYYDGSQYFQKKSMTDMLGRISTFGVGNKQGADPSNVNLPVSIGQKGSVLWVRDAGYAVSTSPSYNKQFNYSYNSNGQKTSETNLNGTVLNRMPTAEAEELLRFFAELVAMEDATYD